MAGWAIDLIRDHVACIECPAPPIADAWRRRCHAIIHEVEEDDQLGRLFWTVLDLYAEAVKRVYPDVRGSGVGIMLVRAALSEIAHNGPADSGYVLLAAQAILAHSQWEDVRLDSELRDIGADSLNRLLDRIDDTSEIENTNAFREFVLAVITVWVRVLPTLHTEAGLEMLGKIAIG